MRDFLGFLFLPSSFIVGKPVGKGLPIGSEGCVVFTLGLYEPGSVKFKGSFGFAR